MSACKCVNEEISCSGNSYYNLKNIFVGISNALKDEEKHFKIFTLNNTAINELEANIFGDITFDWILIMSAYNLTKINTEAFVSTKKSVKLFAIHDTPHGNGIYDATNGMKNLEQLYLVNTSITSIPPNAFANFIKLEILFIWKNRNLKSLGVNAFYELNNLTTLSFDSNPSDYNFDRAFSFRNSSANMLNIYFSYMTNLSSNSFSSETFATIKRPFSLNFFFDAALKYLDEKIFGVVLSGGNQIDLLNTPLECDCRMYWLYANRAQHQSLVRDALCTDGDSVFVNRQNYTQCNVK